MTKKHSLHVSTSDFLRAEVDPHSTPSSFGISAKSLRDMLDHFSIASSSVSTGVGNIRNENQLAWMFGKNEVRVKSFEGVSKDLCTEIKVDPDEFDEYYLHENRVDLTLPMKEFRVSRIIRLIFSRMLTHTGCTDLGRTTRCQLDHRLLRSHSASHPYEHRRQFRRRLHHLLRYRYNNLRGLQRCPISPTWLC